MQWYWEGSHYNATVGDIILKTIYAALPPNGIASFATLLTPKTIAPHLKTMDQKRLDYWQKRSDEYSLLLGELGIDIDKAEK